MIYCLHALAVLVIILLQSVIFPPKGVYDLFILLSVYLALYRSAQEAVFIIIVFGLVMDSITGGVFGLHCLTYLWIFVGLRLIVTYLDKSSLFFQLGAVLAGILLENFFFWWAGVLPDSFTARESAFLFAGLIRQLILAGITAPLFLLWWRGVVDNLPHTFARLGKKLTAEFYLD